MERAVRAVGSGGAEGRGERSGVTDADHVGWAALLRGHRVNAADVGEGDGLVGLHLDALRSAIGRGEVEGDGRAACREIDRSRARGSAPDNSSGPEFFLCSVMADLIRHLIDGNCNL